MQRLVSRWRLLWLAISVLVPGALPVAAMAGEVPLPEIPQARARVSATQGCVEPTPEMRRNHMKYILHQRDETMHEGIRTRQYSLEECVNCHATPGADGEVPRAHEPGHFCSSCHSYAAVDIDCFQCHADRPTRDSQIPAVERVSTTHGEPPGVVTSLSHTARAQTVDAQAAERATR